MLVKSDILGWQKQFLTIQESISFSSKSHVAALNNPNCLSDFFHFCTPYNPLRLWTLDLIEKHLFDPLHAIKHIHLSVTYESVEAAGWNNNSTKTGCVPGADVMKYDM